MTLECLVILSTADGRGVAEVRVKTLHQLARLMPAQVVSYEVRDNGESVRAPISDAELYDLLVAVLADIALTPNATGK